MYVYPAHHLIHSHNTYLKLTWPYFHLKLTRDLPEVNLALSLHAPNQKMREAIVPAAKGTPIESLIEALDEHMMALTKRALLENPQSSSNGKEDREFNNVQRVTASKKKRAMIEYVMCKLCVY